MRADTCKMMLCSLCFTHLADSAPLAKCAKLPSTVLAQPALKLPTKSSLSNHFLPSKQQTLMPHMEPYLPTNIAPLMAA